jgi:hypothetical protein
LGGQLARELLTGNSIFDRLPTSTEQAAEEAVTTTTELSDQAEALLEEFQRVDNFDVTAGSFESPEKLAKVLEAELLESGVGVSDLANIDTGSLSNDLAGAIHEVYTSQDGNVVQLDETISGIFEEYGVDSDTYAIGNLWSKVFSGNIKPEYFEADGIDSIQDLLQYSADKNPQWQRPGDIFTTSVESNTSKVIQVSGDRQDLEDLWRSGDASLNSVTGELEVNVYHNINYDNWENGWVEIDVPNQGFNADTARILGGVTVALIAGTSLVYAYKHRNELKQKLPDNWLAGGSVFDKLRDFVGLTDPDDYEYEDDEIDEEHQPLHPGDIRPRFPEVFDTPQFDIDINKTVYQKHQRKRQIGQEFDLQGYRQAYNSTTEGGIDTTDPESQQVQIDALNDYISVPAHACFWKGGKSRRVRQFVYEEDRGCIGVEFYNGQGQIPSIDSFFNPNYDDYTFDIDSEYEAEDTLRKKDWNRTADSVYHKIQDKNMKNIPIESFYKTIIDSYLNNQDPTNDYVVTIVRTYAKYLMRLVSQRASNYSLQVKVNSEIYNVTLTQDGELQYVDGEGRVNLINNWQLFAKTSGYNVSLVKSI